MSRIQTKPAVGKTFSRKPAHSLWMELLVYSVPSACSGTCYHPVVCVCECVFVGANTDCSLDYSDMEQCACAGSEITIAVSSDVRHGV